MLLQRLTGLEDIAIGVPLSERRQAELEGMIGLFTNPIVIRTSLSNQPTFRELLRRVKETTLDGFVHPIPFSAIMSRLGEKEMNRLGGLLCRAIFNFVDTPGCQVELPGLQSQTFIPLSLEPESSVDIGLHIYIEDTGVSCCVTYKKALFSPARIEGMVHQWIGLLEQILESPEKRITDFSLVTASSKSLLPDPVAELVMPGHASLPARLADHVRSAPDHIVVVDSKGEWTYRELHARSNQVARFLIEHGVGQHSVVAVAGPPSVLLICAWLGVLKARAAIALVPESSDLNSLRKLNVKAWIQAGEGLTHSCLKEEAALGEGCRLSLTHASLSDAEGTLAKYDSSELPIAIGLADLAFVYGHTSDQSLEPLYGTHRRLSHFAKCTSDALALERADRTGLSPCLPQTRLLHEVATSLWIGATICIPEQQDWSADRLPSWAGNMQLSVLPCERAMARSWNAKPGSLPTLRRVLFHGVGLTPQDAIRLKRVAPKVECFRSFSPSDALEPVALLAVHPRASLSEEMKVGQAIPGCQLLVLNGSGTLAGIGEPGEVFVRMPELDQWFSEDSHLKDEMIKPNPHRSGDWLLRTRYCGRYLLDGNLELIGAKIDV